MHFQTTTFNNARMLIYLVNYVATYIIASVL